MLKNHLLKDPDYQKAITWLKELNKWMLKEQVIDSRRDEREPPRFPTSS